MDYRLIDAIYYHAVATCAAAFILGACIIVAASIVRGTPLILKGWLGKSASS